MSTGVGTGAQAKKDTNARLHLRCRIGAGYACIETEFVVEDCGNQGGEIVLVFAMYLVLVVALPVMLSAAIGYRSLPRGHACPNCAQETLPLLSHTLRAIKQMLPALSVHRRWCPVCSWEGYARHTDIAPVIAIADPLVSARQTEPLRSLELGGRSWNVMLEYWRERGRCYGRLLFVGPSGKLWCDPLAAFHGQTQQDVMQQALALSDRLLTYRLREVISG